MKRVLSHLGMALLGAGVAIIVLKKGCPPVPVPADQTPPPVTSAPIPVPIPPPIVEVVPAPPASAVK